MKPRTALFSAAAIMAAHLVWRNLRRQSSFDPSGKVVLITGGSRGLGLALAREFGAHGAVVAICARNPEELAHAAMDLTSRSISCRAFVCDVSNRSDVEKMIAEVEESFGPVAVLVNNAGVIKVGPAVEMQAPDYKQAMDVMFWGTLHTILAVLPAMRERASGRIVNITSIGGLVSVPHLLPYSCAKFATVALSEGLRAELGSHGIRVTTIAPGLMRTGSHLKAEFKGQHSKEYAWFGAGAASPLVSISAERAASAIVSATIRGDAERILSLPAQALAIFHRTFPSLMSDVMELVGGLMPAESEHPFSSSRIGSELERNFTSRLWKSFTRSGQRAADSLNQ